MQSNNSIVLNASGIGITGNTSGLFIAPIRYAPGSSGQTAGAYALQYNSSTNEITCVDSTFNNQQNLASFSATNVIVPNFAFIWNVSSFTTGATPLCIAMSASGQYQYLSYYTAQTVYSSTNYGVTWTQLTGTGATNRQVYCDSTGLYVVTGTLAGGTTYYSTDGGVTWNTFSGITGFLDAASFSQNRQIQCITTDTGIFISNDSGITWTQTYAEVTFKTKNAMSASGQYITVGNETATIIVSSNYGNTWFLVTLPAAPTFISMSASGQYQTATTASGIYVSSNFGKTWQVGTNTSGINAGTCVVMTSSGQYQIATYSVDTSNCFISTNYGATWTISPVSDGLNAGFGPIAISSSGQYITAADGSNIILSVDSAFDTQITQVPFSSTGVILSNFGETWSANPGISLPQPINQASRIGGMNASGQIISITATKGVFYSTDGGLSWAGPASGSPTNGRTLVMSANGKYQLLQTQTGAYLSTNGPVNPTFSLISTIPSTTLASIAMSLDGKYMGVIKGGNGNTCYLSSNYGQSWNTATINYSISGFALNIIVISASGKYQTIVTTNSGAGAVNYVFISNDFGASFNLAYSGSNLYFTGLAMSASGQYQIFAADDDYAVSHTYSRLFTSTDYGVTWNVIPSTAFPASIQPYSYAVGPILMSASGQYIYCTSTLINAKICSTNFGGTWTQVSAYANSPSPLISASGQNMLYVGGTGTTVYQNNILIPPNGSYYGDYLSWNSYTSSYATTSADGAKNITIGNFAGQTGQSGYSIAIGASAGNSGQTGYGIALGYYAGSRKQSDYAIAIGSNAGQTAQGAYSINIGQGAGGTASGAYSVAIGQLAGNLASGTGSIFIGQLAGYYRSGINSIAIGSGAASYLNQGNNAIAIGSTAAGNNPQQNTAIAIGYYTGYNSQQIDAIAIGPSAGYNIQKNNAIAIGNYAGHQLQNYSAVAIGSFAGQTASTTVAQNSVAIGAGAGSYLQNNFATAIGYLAGSVGQGLNTVSIGNQAGQTAPGNYSVAIGSGAGANTQPANSIVIYAGPTSFNNYFASANGGFFVNPIRPSTSGFTSGGNTGLMLYDPQYNEIRYNPAKTFVINDPADKNKYLIHASLEGPEAGVYYRGKGEIVEGDLTTIELPEYISSLATNFSSIVTPIFDPLNPEPKVYEVGEVENSSFIVCGPPGKFFWLVYGERLSLEVEPDKDSVTRKGFGPYTWLEK